jgi:hypothetical protein
MTALGTAALQKAGERLGALAGGLSRHGFATHIVTTEKGPFLRVTNRTMTSLSEDVRAASAGDGSWWFWWSWAERISSTDEVDAAAVKIASVLAPHHG